MLWGKIFFWCECYILLFWTHTFGIWFYWYLVLLVFGLIGVSSYGLGGFSKEKHKSHGVGSPPGEVLEKRQPAKPRMSLFENWLLSHFDTGFRI